ncbi:MAG: head maturation protease, ClpP-related [Pirellulales bacterium]
MNDEKIGEIELRGEIGSYGTSAQQFADQLKALGDVNVIRLLINSEGGSVFDAASMYTQLLRHPARKEAIVEGIAASAASYLVQACGSIEMAPFSFLMIHCASCGSLGTSSDMIKTATILDELDGAIAAVYARRTRSRADSWLKLMRAETWLDGREAVNLGLATHAMDGDAKPITSAFAKAQRGVANRPTSACNAISAIRDARANSTQRSIPASRRDVLMFSERVRADQIAEGREENRQRIISNGSPRQAAKFLKWS